MKEFKEKMPHLIPLCLVGVYHSNLVLYRKDQIYTHAIAETNEQTLTTSK